MRKILFGLLALTAFPVSASAANLLVNGSFEDSTSNFTTPPGWTNVGHTDGVLSYADTGQPAYDGLEFYSLGGAGDNGFAFPGEGIEQTVATTAGDTYSLTFGYSDENCPGCSTVLTVNIGGFSQDYTLTADGGGFFRKPFTTAEIDGFTATGPSTTISFILKSTTNLGNNDPLIDGVVFEQTASVTPGVPEPATWAMMLVGFGGLGAMLRRRRSAALAA